MIRLKFRLYAVCLIAIMSVNPADALEKAKTSSAQDRQASVEKLVEISSAAQRIDKSGNKAAMMRRNEARLLLRKAKDANASGDTAEADKLLHKATQVMFEAVRLMEKDQSLTDKEHNDFNARLDSINALCEAYDRIRGEKGLGPAKQSELYPIVRQKLAQAKDLDEHGKTTQGRKLLDEAYVAAKVAIEHLRGGDTLVRSLSFANKEEEYRYEIDRNDTHKMLVNVLLKEKMAENTKIKAMVDKYMERAISLREKAENQAAGGNYQGAIHTLEESTKEIVKSIRSAGIYIPG